MPAHVDLDHPHIHLTLDFIVLLLGRALLLLADPTARAAHPCDEGADDGSERAKSQEDTPC